jgi:ribosomal protein S18 acetylase RimI-like enzyme
MRKPDLPALLAVADIVHPAYPEDPAVFAERLDLYPAGCLVLELGGKAIGYIVSHPWFYAEPPKLNSRLRVLPTDSTTYYIHDIALLPEARGTGAATAVIDRLVAHAGQRGLRNISLVAVNDSGQFWRRHGFDSVDDPKLAAKLRSYDGNARFMVREIFTPKTAAT